MQVKSVKRDKAEKVVGLLKERNDEEIKGGGGKEKKKFGLKQPIMARNSLEILWGYSPNQKVFGHYVSTLGSVSIEDMIHPQLETKRVFENPRNSKM